MVVEAGIGHGVGVAFQARAISKLIGRDRRVVVMAAIIGDQVLHALG